jgi:hypothetical protein
MTAATAAKKGRAGVTLFRTFWTGVFILIFFFYGYFAEELQGKANAKQKALNCHLLSTP